VRVEESVATAIREAIGDNGFEAAVELGIFGSDDPLIMAAAVVGFCESELRAAPQRCLFYTSSQGAVFGLELEDKRHVVIKVHQPGRSADFLAAIHMVQRYLRRERFPCPAPIVGPLPLSGGLALVDELLEDGEFADAHDPLVRGQMAAALAELVRLAQRFVSERSLPRNPWRSSAPGSLWKAPHHRMFDFDATASGAEWIDAIAAGALEQLASPAGELVVGHNDWSVKDFRFQGGKISAIYDWDSLVVDLEPVIVGHAATHFTMTWRMPVLVAPRSDEVEAFVAEYESARRKPFSNAERATLRGAGLHSMAYTARCEHALDPSASEFPVGSAREFLRRECWPA
jgi:Ser/Thr protein kinase RdoA (MazF antagonist)